MRTSTKPLAVPKGAAAALRLQFIGHAGPAAPPATRALPRAAAAIGAWVGPKSGGSYVLLFPDAN